jgi:hypothetical protein
MLESETTAGKNGSGFIGELQARLPGLNGTQALGWASAAVKHLAQYLDAHGREELARHLPSHLIPAAQEAGRLADLFGSEKPGDFFLMATMDAGAPPSSHGTRDTLANVMAAIRKCIPDGSAQTIAKGLPSEVAQLWGS